MRDLFVPQTFGRPAISVTHTSSLVSSTSNPLFSPRIPSPTKYYRHVRWTAQQSNIQEMNEWSALTSKQANKKYNTLFFFLLLPFPQWICLQKENVWVLRSSEWIWNFYILCDLNYPSAFTPSSSRREIRGSSSSGDRFSQHWRCLRHVASVC